MAAAAERSLCILREKICRFTKRQESIFLLPVTVVCKELEKQVCAAVPIG